jgi:hypothetical protein
MKNLTSRELHEAIGQALDEVARRLESGELAAGAATGGKPLSAKPEKVSAA